MAKTQPVIDIHVHIQPWRMLRPEVLKLWKRHHPDRAQEYGIPVMFHTGTSVFPGARVKYGNPIYLDDVAVDFPELKIILAHGGRPIWMATAFFLLRRHANIYLDISSIPPQRLLEYFPRIEEIAHKAMFGSDWPGPGVKSIRQNIEKFLELPLSHEAKRAILYENAAGLFTTQ